MGGTNRGLDIGFSALLVLVIGWVVYQGSSFYLSQLTGLELPRGWGRQAGLFPMVVGTPALVLAVLQLISALRPRPVPADEGEVAVVDGAAVQDPDDAGVRSVGIIGTMVSFAAAIWLLGFLIAVPLGIFGYLRFVAKESWRISVGLATIGGSVFYLMLIELAGVAIPDGRLIEALFQ